MSESAYEIAALAMRFWLAALMVFLLWRIVRAVLRDYSVQRTERKAETGYALGMLEVVAPETDGRGRVHPMYGRRFALKRENRIGSSRSADIRVKQRGVAPCQASIYQKGNRVLLTDYGGRSGTFLNGERVKDDTPLFDGDEIDVGGVEMVLHLVTAAGGGRRQPVLSGEERGGGLDYPIQEDEPDAADREDGDADYDTTEEGEAYEAEREQEEDEEEPPAKRGRRRWRR